MTIATGYVYLSYLRADEFVAINTFIQGNSILFFLLGISILISFVNIPVFAIAGFLFLLKRRRIMLGLILWMAAGAFFYVGRQVGDAW